MIVALCKRGKIKEAADYLAQHIPVKKRQDYNYNTILAACVAQGNFELGLYKSCRTMAHG